MFFLVFFLFLNKHSFSPSNHFFLVKICNLHTTQVPFLILFSQTGHAENQDFVQFGRSALGHIKDIVFHSIRKQFCGHSLYWPRDDIMAFIELYLSMCMNPSSDRLEHKLRSTYVFVEAHLWPPPLTNDALLKHYTFESLRGLTLKIVLKGILPLRNNLWLNRSCWTSLYWKFKTQPPSRKKNPHIFFGKRGPFSASLKRPIVLLCIKKDAYF